MKDKKPRSHTNPYEFILLFKKVWKKRQITYRAVILGLIIGCLIAIIAPIVYESSTTFVPQTSDTKSGSNNTSLGSLASLAGINLNAITESSLENYLSPLLYSKIIESDEFSLDLLNQKVILKDGDIKIMKDYLKESKKSVFGSLFEKVVGLIKSILKSEDSQLDEKIIFQDYNYITQDDSQLIEIFKQKFNIEVNKKQGYIRVSATDKDAFISTQLVNMITESLQSKIISLRTNKIREQLGFSEEQYKKQKKVFEKVQNDLARFNDSNKNISTAVFLSNRQKLESEYNLQENILTSLATEFNNNKINLNKDTPIFSVLDEVSIPNKRSKPKRKQIVLFMVIISSLISVGYILLEESIKKILIYLKEN